MSTERVELMKSPCEACPFNRKCKPNALGGSDPAVYIGQAYGPFWLPCHMDTDFQDPKWTQDVTKAQCAGAAIFRANVGVANRMPVFLVKRPADFKVVFANPIELLAHHKQIPFAEAQEILRQTPPQALLAIEFNKAEVRKLAVPKKDTNEKKT